MKTATSLFDFVPGAELEPPTDDIMREQDAELRDRERLKEILRESDTICQRMNFLKPDSKLTAARYLAKAINSTTRMFNAAIFLRDKHEEGEELFTKPTDLFE